MEEDKETEVLAAGKPEFNADNIPERHILVAEALENSEEYFGLNLHDVAEITEIPESFLIKAKNGKKIADTLQDVLMNFFNYIIKYRERLYKNKVQIAVKYYIPHKSK